MINKQVKAVKNKTFAKKTAGYDEISKTSPILSTT